MAKVILELEVDTEDVGFALNEIGGIEAKLGEWCEEQGFVKMYHIKRYEKRRGKDAKRKIHTDCSR